MEEQKECDLMMGLQLQEQSTTNHIRSDCIEKEMEISNKTSNSPTEVKKEEVVKLIQLMSVSMICIYQEICKQKEEEHQINNKLSWCSRGDKLIESKTQAIRNLEHSLGKVKPNLPIRSIPRTSVFFHLTEKDAETPVVLGTDRKRCQNRLKKERTDLEYLEQVQEELLFLKKSGGSTLAGTQEHNDVMESLVHRIQHGNNNRAEETKFFHEIRKLEETIEKYKFTATREPSLNDYWNNRVVGAGQRRANANKANELKIIILLNDIKEVKRDRMAHTARAILLKAELEHVRKNIRCMEREVEKINSKRMQVYKRAYELREQMEVKYCFNTYEWVVTYVKRLVREGDVVALRRVCDNKLEDFTRKWSHGKVFSWWAYENINSNKKKELGEQTKEKSSCIDYQSLVTYVKKLVRGGDVVALRQVCDKQADEFLRQWSNSELFLDD
ncbi:hypothetical protein L6452_15664 [Arctium lappa]|uniref:Uncharacterized protein n=3 Tax=Arctium lappa TaxID=4217 RepID=A0ACB9CPI6_ARCLA|nr:hypothetical protein L6452_15659 [Arctium lappa]KAI3736126.1 hypothetical protein L6452_15660 [Arctium lappa]KAI3736130.1 hypothetical protein L6452_15664 [Arctium lappa]